MNELLELLESLRLEHYYNEDDCWYSCPKSEDGCCNDNIPADLCTCGADEHNAKLDRAIAMVEDIVVVSTSALLTEMDGKDEYVMCPQGYSAEAWKDGEYNFGMVDKDWMEITHENIRK